MALVSKGTYLNVTLADAAGNKSTLRYALDFADLAALNTGAASIATILAALDAVTDANVIAYNMGEDFAEDAVFYGTPGSEVENVALITARVDGSTPAKFTTLRVPAPNDGVFLGTTGENRNIVDTADAAIRTYLGLFTSTGHVTVSDGERIEDPTAAGTWKGKRIHRGSRNG
jgi:hypothetical protein